MQLSSKRFVGRGGARVIAMALRGSPYVYAYNFNFKTGWGSRYANPGTSAGFDLEGTGVAWGAGNNRLLLSGRAAASLRVYDWDNTSGFGTRNNTTFANPRSVACSKDGNYILVSGPNEMVEYNYSAGGGVGSDRATLSSSGFIRISAYIMDDNYVVVASDDPNRSFRIYSRGSSFTLTADNGSFFGAPRSFSMSPIVHSSTRVLAIGHNGSTLRLYPVTTSGTLGSVITSTVGGTVQSAIFDPYGRLIVGFSAALRIYTLDSSGNQTLLATASDFSGGVIDSFAYDADSDVLFVGSLSAPYITAYRMGGLGFVSKYADPSTAVTSGVLDIAVQYEEAWKNTVI